MQCEDCKAAADLEALPGLAKVVHLLDPDRQDALDGHERCRARGGCTCQHGDNGRYQPTKEHQRS